MSNATKQIYGGFFWIYTFSILFITANIALIINKFYWLSFLPVLLILIITALFSLDIILLCIVFFTPLSLNLENLQLGGIGMFLPTEPLLFGVMLLFLIRFFYDNRFERKFLFHPVTLAIIFNLTWIFITSITSELPIVSFKFLISRLWFVISFYFIATFLFKKQNAIRKFLWLYLIPLIGVVIYTLYQHYLNGFDEKSAHWVMQPFFKDHTSYGAILAMFFPIVIGFAFYKNYSQMTRLVAFLITIIIAVGIIFSYTRAAWISLLIAFGLFTVIMLKIKFRTILISIGVVLILFFSFQEQIRMKLEKNKQDSSDKLSEHVQSMSNIATDASNLERLNRWDCAYKMFLEKPVFGWGPGTYMFLYAPFQYSKNLTIISTNFGDLGNAHSEYIGPLAESGVFGSISFIMIAFAVIYTAIRLYFQLQDIHLKRTLITILLGLATYLVHGFLNNYLDTDKASVPFWGFIAIIVAMDIFHNTAQKTNK